MKTEQLSFPDWFGLVFRRIDTLNPPTWGGEGINWCLDPDIRLMAPMLLRYSTFVFRDPVGLLGHLTQQERRDGLHEIRSEFLSFLWDRTIPAATRRGCIGSMFNLFDRFFRTDGRSDLCAEWWNTGVYDFPSPDDGPDPPEGREMEMDAMTFPIMRRILFKIDDEECRKSALRGFNERALKNPAAIKIIDEFLRAFPRIDDDMRQFAEYCKTNEIL